jgi:hypothetical protein
MNNPQNYYDLILGTTILLLGIVGGVIISNKILLLFTEDKELNFIILLAYLLMIVMFVFLVQYILDRVVVNQKILRAISGLTGPLIGTSSLFLAPTIGNFVKQI